MESISSLNQSSRLTKRILIAISTLALLSCESKPKKPKESPLEPPSFQLPGLVWNAPEQAAGTNPSAITTSEFTPLIRTGDSIYPQFDDKGTRLFYSSGGRQQHSHFEVYFTDLGTEKEERITFQKADALLSAHHPHREQILYTTANEELIRQPDLIFQKLKSKKVADTPKKPGLHLVYGASDIFSQDLSDKSRDELTRTNGFDGWASYSNNGRRVVFSSNRKARNNIYSMNLRGRQFRSVVISPSEDIQIRVSPNQKRMIWVRRGGSTPGSTFLIADVNGRNLLEVQIPNGDHLFPSWHSNGEWIFFSSNLADGKNFSLYAMSSQGKCLTRLTSDDVHALFPIAHPREGRVFYAKLDYGQWVIGSREITLPKTCVMDSP